MWIGSGVPVGATKGMIEAFENRVTRSPSDGDIDITVVVNDDNMTDESHVVNEVYGSREELPFDVTVVKELTIDELQQVFKTHTDFLHYIGHIDKNGFECLDGVFDVGEIEKTAVDAFFLNACDSYQQGKRLVEAGSIAGVATLTPVPNEKAEKMGRKIARLLNLGFPLYAALDVANMGQGHNDYTVIGDSSFNIVQSNVGIAPSVKIKRVSNKYKMTYQTYPTNEIGSITTIFVDEADKYFLTSGRIGEFELNENDALDFLSAEKIPIIMNSEIYWDENILD